MNLFEEFLSQMGIFANHLEDIPYLTDDTDYVIVDGEEGDYGTIRYLDAGGSLLGVKVCAGGDAYDFMFTTFGVEKLTPMAKKWFDEKIEEHIKNAFNQ